ncbi:protein ACTIVITY OF BC1 COMPLEX KINASE 1, chloroplastic-like [Telopea speciosissima]|uniref:protein ACTIVITY OF BC1 COMPLEX KINASE 1, chloroplastic-like n=1 Tax=Telopea speciosissima TaxID=54955 RepID=UPI001CC7BF5B|nr:protein ACTIVITY OF BC1 COMPLEX KINASE 1, chloroplastic-like [Telopea speciosissima]
MVGTVTGFARKELPITYLGAPLYAGRLKYFFSDDLIGKIRNKVAGWKGKLLFGGGRVTLVKHVLTSIPIHILATLELPKTVLRRIYSIFADFLWGNSQWGKRRHWVRWQKICRPVEEEGLGISLLEDFGLSLRLKGFWRVISDSSLWSAFFGAKIFKGVHVALGSGDISFWPDNWVVVGPLIDYVDNALEVDSDLLGKDAVDEVGSWRLDLLNRIDSDEVRQSIVQGGFAMSGTDDVMVWTVASDGCFTAKSAWNEFVTLQVQRPGIEPIIYRDLFLFRTLASFLNGISLQKLGCNAELIVDEFGEKLLEELDYTLEARNIEDFLENFKNDPTVKIPRVYKKLSGPHVLVMEWIDGIRCTNPQAIKEAGIDVNGFLTIGVSAALRQLLEFGFFHGDPHPGNIFAMRDGRIAYVDFGNVAVLSQQNKQILIDAVVHAVNEDYVEMANDFTRLGFLASGTDVLPIIPALEAIWQNSSGKGLSDFNFRSVTGKFNQLVYQYPIRIPERFSLVIRSLLTQEGICFTLKPDFKFLEVAYPYVAKRLLTDPNPALRERLIQVIFKYGVFTLRHFRKDLDVYLFK